MPVESTTLSIIAFLYIPIMPGDVLAQWLVRRTSDEPDRFIHVLFLGKTLNSHSPSLNPDV